MTEVDHERAKGYITAQLPYLKEAYFPLSFKLSSEFGSAYQMYYMKLAQQNALSATIVDEKGAVSPFGSDHS
nr:YueI family protein [Streptococcus equi]